MKNKLIAVLLVGVIACLCIQCGKKISEDHLIRIGEKDYLRKEEFISNFIRSKPFSENILFSVKILKDHIKYTFLDDLTFLVEAERLGYERDSRIAAALEMQKRQIMLRNSELIFQKTLIPEKLNVDSSAVLEFYSKRQYKLKLAHIVVAIPKLADSLYRQLQAGADFAELAKKFSVEIESGRSGGELANPILWGTMAQDFEAAAFALNIGEYSKPIFTDFAYQIIKVLDKIPNEQKPFPQIERKLKARLLRVKRKREIEKYVLSLYDKFDVNIVESTAQLITNIYHSNKNAQKSDLDISTLPDKQKKQIILSFANEKWTVTDFAAKFRKQGTINKIPLRNIPEVKNFIRKLLVQDLLYADAKAFKIDQDKAFLTEFEIFRNRILIKKAKNGLVYKHITVEEYEVRDYYNVHKTEYANRSYEEVRKGCKNRLYLEKRQADERLKAYKLRKKYAIQYNEELLLQLCDELTTIKRSSPQKKKIFRKTPRKPV